MRAGKSAFTLSAACVGACMHAVLKAKTVWIQQRRVDVQMMERILLDTYNVLMKSYQGK
jgi:hypothetical protein